MDRVRTKSKASRIKRPAIIAGVAMVLISGGVMLANIDFSTHRVDRTTLTVETVQQGTMEVKVGANGQLLSKHVEQLAAQVSARVAKADIKPGAVVRVGQVLVELANPDLIASAEEAQSAWEGAVAELQSSEAELQTNMLNQEVVLTGAQFSSEKAQVKTEADETLAREGLLPGIELKRSQLDRTQLKKVYEIEGSRLKKVRDNIGVQLAVKKSKVAQLARALDRARTQAADLKVVAGINGIVQAITVEVGQQLQPGSPIGRIAQQDQLYAELKVPAREATQVQAGQKVIVDTRNGTVDGIVTRVDPGVTDGTVVVDVDLRGVVPAGARPQLPVEGTIYVSQLPNTLYVGKPSYVKNDTSMSVYKLDPAGQYAARVTIKAGKVSLNYLQVLQGLQAGDRIITSEIGAWQGQDRILLK
ncbi:MAG TPA: HlyD family efflux transporter periplasmic adaptor subunit [Thermoanaerobaculia bacterium]|nr:HlyD family efflux transporter periplasmic adaptor subunit [Thermoanaerobaculia bacterium]